MGRRRDAKAKIEHGDFQTPPALAAEVCRLLASHGVHPRSIVEPTCGTGGLLRAALDEFPAFHRALGVDLDDGHVHTARAAQRDRADAGRVAIERGCFFAADWPAHLAALPDPILVIGNPPWVTSSDLGALGSRNVPDKSPAPGDTGLDALTGKSNFDLSEWMLRKLMTWLDGRAAVLAMLCKASVARKVLAFAWTAGVQLRSAALYRVDAARHFGAAVEAGLLVAELAPGARSQQCRVFDRLDAAAPAATLGYRDGRLIADVATYDRWRALQGEQGEPRGASPWVWRSGIKHDCAAVMELRRSGDGYENGDGERLDLEDLADLEDRWLYPLCKSSDVARDGAMTPHRHLLVPQRRLGDDTRQLQQSAPRIWRYLMRHRTRLDRRASAIYRGKPPFSIFGVGDYTFAPWKVAISGLYKKLAFRVVGPHEGKPVVFDDTCYFLACGSEALARFVAALLGSEPAAQFYGSQVFWDAKRPITTELLRRLDLRRLADVLGRGGELARLAPASAASASPPSQQPE
jgi:hypothetical protein